MKPFFRPSRLISTRTAHPTRFARSKKTSEQNIFLIPGIQNPISTEYTRLQPIRTGVTQTRTLLFYSLDILGDHTNALICSGMTADNMQLLSVYIPLKEKTETVGYTTVADLRADGSITIQEIARSDAYNLALTNGDSYPPPHLYI